MSFVAEPYQYVTDQVLTALTGGVARETHRFFAAANGFGFEEGPDAVVPESVRVIGQATEPLAIPYRDHMTVLDVMITVKGLTRYAAGNRAVIVRHEPGGREKTIRVHLNDLLKDGDISQNVAMEPGDILIIPQTWF